MMWSNERPSRVIIVLQILLALVVALLVPIDPAGAVNTWTDDTSTVTITVKVEVYSSENAGKWVKKVRKAFKNCLQTPEWKIGCPKVKFKLEIVPGKEGGEPNDYHKVVSTKKKVKDWTDGVSRSRVEMLVEKPTKDNYFGNWDSDNNEIVICHEFLHLLGLRDEYKQFKAGPDRESFFTKPDPLKAPEYRWDDRNGNDEVDWDDHNKNEMVDKDENRAEIDSIKLKPGEKGSLLAELEGEILKRHIKKIVIMHLDKDPCKS
jgi:hypothetical protein